MKTPESKQRSLLVDFELCHGREALARTMERINREGHALITVTQDMYGTYTVFFRRCVGG